MMPRIPWSKPAIGMLFMFKENGVQPLGGIPARVISVWPRFRSGDYLVTLEYEKPVKVRNANISHIDAFMSELEPVLAERTVSSAL
jgi:hypothetical protein